VDLWYAHSVDDGVRAALDPELGSNELRLARRCKGRVALGALQHGERPLGQDERKYLESKRLEVCGSANSRSSLVARPSSHDDADGCKGGLGVLRGEDDSILVRSNLIWVIARLHHRRYGPSGR
jgi:hypothetical protein